MTPTETNAMQKRGRGRPPAEETMQQISIRIPDELFERIDTIIRQRDGQSDRATIIREAISKGLTVMGA